MTDRAINVNREKRRDLFVPCRAIKRRLVKEFLFKYAENLVVVVAFDGLIIFSATVRNFTGISRSDGSGEKK